MPIGSVVHGKPAPKLGPLGHLPATQPRVPTHNATPPSGIAVTFGSPTTITAWSYVGTDLATHYVSRSVVRTADVDGDGKLDIVAVDGLITPHDTTICAGASSCGTVTVYYGNGGGMFSSGTRYIVSSGSYLTPTSVTVADFNKDGKPDIAVTFAEAVQQPGCSSSNCAQGAVAVLLGQGSRTFGAPIVTPIAQHSPDATGNTATGGLQDIAPLPSAGQFLGVVVGGATDFCCSMMYSLKGNGNGTFTSTSSLDYQLNSASINGGYGNGFSEVLVGNINGDRLPDVVGVDASCSNDYGHFNVMYNNGDGSLTEANSSEEPNAQTTAGSCPGLVALVDVNGDGILDLVGTLQPNSWKSTNMVVATWFGDGLGFPSSAVPVTSQSYSAGTNTSIHTQTVGADFNQDGDVDVAVAPWQFTPSVGVATGSGDGTFVAQSALSDASLTGRAAVGNLDAGFMPDLVTTDIGDGSTTFPSIKVYLNSTTPPASSLPPSLTTGGGFPNSPPTTCSCGAPVNTATGEFWHHFDDLAVPGRGMALNFNRTYSASLAAQDGPLGHGWTDSYQMALTTDPSTGNITVHAGNGSVVTFTLNGSVYQPPSYVLASLVKNGDGTFTYTDHDQTRSVFSAAGQLLTEVDRNGYATTFTYTGAVLSKVTDPAARSLTFAYGSGGRIASVTDPASRKISFSYDASGNLITATDVTGGRWQFSYDANHLMLTVTDPRGGVLTNVYDTSSRVISQTDAMSRKTIFAYASGQNGAEATTLTDAKGNQTLYQYQNLELTAVTKGYGTPQASTTRYTYDPVTHSMATMTDPNGHVTTSTYDSSGNLLTVIDALGHKTTNTYDKLNDLLTSKDPMGVTTTMTYDAAGNLLTTSRPLTGTTKVQIITYQHTDASHPGDVTGIVDPNGKTSTLAYDPYGDVATAVDPLGNKATATYNTIGWKLTSVSPKGNVAGCGCSAKYTTTFAHDPDGRVTTVTDPLGHKAVSHYDQDRNLDRFTGADGNKTTYTYDADNELTVTTRADTTTLKTDYNADGTILDQIDGKGNATTYKYDSLARAISVTDPLSRATTFTYDAAGNRLTLTDPQSQVTTYAYDVGNELTSITYSDGKTAKVSGITYDTDGRRTAMTDGTGTSTWTWDSLGRLITSKNGAGSTVSYAYDLKGQLTTLTYPNGKKVTRGYDNGGRLTSVSDWLSHTTRFGYDANSNLVTETLPTTTGIIDTFTFDHADNLTTLSDKKGGTTIFTAAYGRDSANQLTSDTSVPAAVGKYKYTTLNQLCYAGSANSTACASPPSSSYPYTFDSADNLTKTENATHTGSVTQQFNAADELCWTVAGASANACASAPTGSTTYAYDTRGNRTGTLTGTAGTCDAFDQANSLTSIKKGTGATCTTPTTVGTYGYNGDGLRMSKTIGANTTQNTWGMGLLLQEKVGSATATSYVYGPGDLPLEQITPAGTVYYYHHDQLGSTRAITNSAGAAKATYTYDPYGNVTACTGARVTVTGSNICTGTITVTNPLTYSGQYRDSESGLYYLRARYYDPTTAQFLSRDPLVATTMSPYAYTNGDPLNATDPTGLCWGPGCWVLDQLHQHGMCDVLVDANCQSEASQFANSSAGERINAIVDRYSHGLSSWVEGQFGVSYNHCSANWLDAHDSLAGTLAEALGDYTIFRGMSWGAARLLPRGELPIPGGNGARVSLGNPTATTADGGINWVAWLPHYHRRILDDAGNIVFRGGLKWHRPWEGW